jgi:xanthine dehydrogenase accessory factor
VIGSVTKGRKFRQRLKAKAYPQSAIDQLHCPMGLEGISGKLPMEVAIAIAAKVMALYQSPAECTSHTQTQAENEVLTHV